MRLRLVEQVPGGSWRCLVVRVHEKHMEGASGVYGRCTGLAMPVVCLSMSGVRGGSGRVVLARSFRQKGTPAAGGASACGFGSCTGLCVAVRRIGGADGPAHVHIADRGRVGADGAHNRSLSRTVTASGVRIEGGLDPLADQVILAVGAVQVDVMQDTGAGPHPRGDLGGRAAGVQPSPQGGVPQVVRAAGERGGGQFRSEGGLACGVPGAAVDGLAERAAAGAGEQPPRAPSHEESRAPGGQRAASLPTRPTPALGLGGIQPRGVSTSRPATSLVLCMSPRLLT